MLHSWSASNKGNFVTTNEKTKVVLVSTPGVMLSSLQTMVNSLPLVEVVGTASGCLSAIEALRQQSGELVIVDTNLPEEEVLVFLSHIQQKFKNVRSVVFTSTRRQKTEYLSAGANVVLPRDITAERLLEVIEI
jgi:DNA-binding NarL/FixJ family response regulator